MEAYKEANGPMQAFGGKREAFVCSYVVDRAGYSNHTSTHGKGGKTKWPNIPTYVDAIWKDIDIGNPNARHAYVLLLVTL